MIFANASISQEIYKMNKIIFILIFIFPMTNLMAQAANPSDTLTITGSIVDEETSTAIPYANIYLDKSRGTVSNVDGNFEFKILRHELNKRSKLKISYIGYEKIVLKLKQFQNREYLDLTISMVPAKVDEVALSPVNDGGIYLHHTFNRNPIKIYKDPVLR
jgi:hypothetical protein